MTKKRTFLHFKFVHLKGSTVGSALHAASRQRTEQGAMSQVTNGWFRNSLCSETHHYWEYESIGAVASANYNVTSGFTTGAGYIQDILHHALNN